MKDFSYKFYPTIYEQGYKSFIRGYDVNRCPYRMGCSFKDMNMMNEWIRGWVAASIRSENEKT